MIQPERLRKGMNQVTSYLISSCTGNTPTLTNKLGSEPVGTDSDRPIAGKDSLCVKTAAFGQNDNICVKYSTYTTQIWMKTVKKTTRHISEDSK